MYCIKCGVALENTEKQCPLCATRAHPDVAQQPEEPALFPGESYPAVQVSTRGLQIILTALFLMPMIICLQCDLLVTNRVTWSGFVIGALLVGYVCGILPLWFKKPNPVIFVPCSFAALGLYLLYINFFTGGHWFLTFAFPVLGFLCLVVSAVVTLLRYVRKGLLYVFGGAFMAIGAFMPLMGFLLNLTFFDPEFAIWSMYPTTPFILLGGFLIFLAICRPAREVMQRKFFI